MISRRLPRKVTLEFSSWTWKARESKAYLSVQSDEIIHRDQQYSRHVRINVSDVIAPWRPWRNSTLRLLTKSTQRAREKRIFSKTYNSLRYSSRNTETGYIKQSDGVVGGLWSWADIHRKGEGGDADGVFTILGPKKLG